MVRGQKKKLYEDGDRDNTCGDEVGDGDSTADTEWGWEWIVVSMQLSIMD